MMKVVDVAIVGGGPAGLMAAVTAAEHGAEVLLIDENSRPGGQLLKQIHKFFGSQEHRAGVRGYKIGEELLAAAEKLEIEVSLSSEVIGRSKDGVLWIARIGRAPLEVRARCTILATGANENSFVFPGWTLPGVMGAGAAQTMINIHRVLPGKRVLMVGSGNVGVIVSYQLLQAGAEVAAIVEAAPQLGGYGVHTAKVRRAGVEFYTSHTVKEARGDTQVEEVELVAVDKKLRPVAGTEKLLSVDTVCIATGLTPLAELAWMAGCRFAHIPALGGFVPVHNSYMQTTQRDIFVAGDLAGIEEASTAMEEGHLAGLAAAMSLGCLAKERGEELAAECRGRMQALRSGPFGRLRQDAKEKIIAEWEVFSCA